MLKLKLETGQKLFFISDTHYNHKNICRGTSSWEDKENTTRDFCDLDKMNFQIIDRINNEVATDDILFHLGDWSFGGLDQIKKFRDQIHCQNIYLVLGNHDHHIEKNEDNVQDLFKGVFHYLNLEVTFPQNNKLVKAQKKNFILSHYPICSWQDMNRGNIHLFGHVHLPPKYKLREGKSLDVGWDGNGGIPYNVEDILDIMRHQPIKKITLPKDHHEKVI